MYENIIIPKSVKEQFDISGRTAVITGGAGFLGQQFAEAIAEMGGTPILVDINQNNLDLTRNNIKNSGYNDCHSYQLDITSEEDSIKVYNEIWMNYDGIDILINSAALTKSGAEKENNYFFAPFEKTNQNLWNQGININLTATQLSCKIIGNKMSKAEGGNIINIASDVGVISPNQSIYQSDEYDYKGVDFNTPAFYSVSKAGVIHLTKYLATYWAKKNIRVNCISPVGVYQDHDPQFVKKLSEQIPMGRMALPNEFKGAISFLASDASSFITGHNLMIDGGRTIW